jgi:acetyl-CoA carboxylase carboxyl transferase alpha subunit
MTPYEKLKAARSADRPTALAYIGKLFTEATELHGDRRFGDDAAIVAGIARLDSIPVTYIATERGANFKERVARSFGCPRPEGYRKALRLMKQAEKFGRPVICLVDTSGAFCGSEAEERGQGQAIAENLAAMMGLETPILTLILGEGESGGALGLAVSDRVYMLENSVYSVISPEGCASILMKDARRAPEKAEHLHLTAADMRLLGISERIIPERFDHFDKMCKSLQGLLQRDIRHLGALPKEELLAARYERFRRFGVFETVQAEVPPQ